MRIARSTAVSIGVLVCIAASAATANAGVCHEDGYHVLKRFHGGVFMTKDSGPNERVFACSPRFGVHAKVGHFNYDPDFFFYGRLVLSNQTAAWATAVGDEAGKAYLDEIGKVDLATGERSSKPGVRAETYSNNTYTNRLRSVALAPSGAIAWMVDYEKRGKTKREIHLWDSTGERIVSRSLVATPKYLARVLGIKQANVTYSHVYRGEDADWPMNTIGSAP